MRRDNVGKPCGVEGGGAVSPMTILQRTIQTTKASHIKMILGLNSKILIRSKSD